MAHTKVWRHKAGIGISSAALVVALGIQNKKISHDCCHSPHYSPQLSAQLAEKNIEPVLCLFWKSLGVAKKLGLFSLEAGPRSKSPVKEPIKGVGYDRNQFSSFQPGEKINHTSLCEWVFSLDGFKAAVVCLQPRAHSTTSSTVMPSTIFVHEFRFKNLIFFCLKGIKPGKSELKKLNRIWTSLTDLHQCVEEGASCSSNRFIFELHDNSFLAQLIWQKLDFKVQW